MTRPKARLNRRPRRHLRLEALEAREVPSTCVVNSLGDSGVGVAADHGDLRFCLSQSNAQPGEDLIVFSVTGAISLTQALPDITDELIIAGPGADQVTIRRDTGGNYRIFTIDAGVTAQIYSITIANGFTATGIPGGGIFNSGTLTVAACAVTGDVSLDDKHGGGGIYNAGSLLVSGTTISGNVLPAAYNARGAGILNDGTGTLLIDDSTISNNHNDNSLLGNAAGGGIANLGAATITDSTVAFNSAKTSNHDSPRAMGGGIANYGALTIDNSTIYGNEIEAKNTGPFATAISLGGGIYNYGGLTVRHSTIAGNAAYVSGYSGIDDTAAGGGIYRYGNSPLDLHNTIVAGNTVSSVSYLEGGPDVDGMLTGTGYNLIGHSFHASGFDSTDLLDVDPLLGSLQDNGGPTLTMALLPGSPAIDSGDNTNAPDWDQRGPGFPRIVNGTIDRGAFEVQNTSGPAVPRSPALATAPAQSSKPAVPETTPTRPVPGPAGKAERSRQGAAGADGTSPARTDGYGGQPWSRAQVLLARQATHPDVFDEPLSAGLT
jgi:hypothetical protein